MNRYLVVVAGTVALLFAPRVALAVDPDTDEEKQLYALGVALSRNLAPFKLSPDELKIVEQGLTDGTTGVTPKVDMSQFGPKIKGLAEARGKAAAKVR